MGTPAYMALEQHMGATSDARTDQFAFCVALFEALAGRRPFHGMTDLELGRAKSLMEVQELPPRPGLRPAVRRAILRGLRDGSAAPCAAVGVAGGRPRWARGWGPVVGGGRVRRSDR
jgi:serine/threonine protein kinase